MLPGRWRLTGWQSRRHCPETQWPWQENVDRAATPPQRIRQVNTALSTVDIKLEIQDHNCFSVFGLIYVFRASFCECGYESGFSVMHGIYLVVQLLLVSQGLCPVVLVGQILDWYTPLPVSVTRSDSLLATFIISVFFIAMFLTGYFYT